MMAEARDPRLEQTPQSAAERLRREAERTLDGFSDSVTPVPEDVAEVVHELRVHQIELEMQNEELRRAQFELDTQRAKYFELFDLAPVGYLTLNDMGIVAEANFMAAHLLGVARHVLLGRPLSDFVFAPDRDVLYLHRRLLRQGGESQTYELRLRREGGECRAEATAGYFWAHLESRPHRAASGEALSIWVTFTDVDERRRAEEALRQSQRWLNESQRVALLGHYVYDVAEDHWDGSPAFYDVLGTDKTHANGIAGWLELVSPADREKMSRHVAEDVLAKGRPFDAEYRIARRSPDGLERWVHGWGNVENGADGRPARVFGVIQDITERKRAEKQLRESESKLKRAQRHAHMGSWTWNIRTNQLDWSDEMFRLYGIEPESFSGSLSDLTRAIHPDDRQDVERANLSVINDARPIPLEYRVVWPDQSIHVLRAEAGELSLDASGDPLLLSGTAQDVTERRLVEAYRDMGRDTLRILNEPGDLQASIVRVVSALKAQTGFDAVGIRLRNGVDFPYVGQEGFSNEFLLTENTLLGRTADGWVCHDEAGNVSLECTCGMVLSAEVGETNPMLTPVGSFWTNDSSSLLDLAPDQDPRFHPRNRCIHEGYASVALVPITDASGIVGLIHINDRRKGRFTPAIVELLEGIAANIGGALMRKRVEQDLHASEQRLLERVSRGQRLNAALIEVNARLNASLELGSAIDDTLEAACEALECDVALLGRAAFDDGRIDHAFGLELPDGGLLLGRSSLGAASQDMTSLLARSESESTSALNTRLGLTEAIIVPVPVHPGTNGALLLGRMSGDLRFDDQSTEFAQRLGLSLALTLANAERFEAERHIADAFQEALLVMPASIRGIEFSHLYRSATATTRVGGDFLDAFETTGGRAGVLVGDVSGKGLEAALLTSIIKDTIKAYAHDTPSPAEAIAHANVVLNQVAAPDEFATAFYAVVGGADNSLVYCNAGHPPAAVIGSDGTVQLLDEASLIIGSFPDAVYADHAVQLAPGETVLLYTDGVTEARDPKGVLFGEERLLSTLRSTGGADVDRLPAAVLDAVWTFSEGRLSDDIALLAFRSAGAPSPVW